jgi:hypothetical protein
MPQHLLKYCQGIDEEQRYKLESHVVPEDASTTLHRPHENTRKRPLEGGHQDITNFFDTKKLKKPEQDKLNAALLRFLINSASSFRLVEDAYFVEFLNELRPAFSVPSRRLLAGRVFSTEEHSITKRLGKWLSGDESLCCDSTASIPPSDSFELTLDTVLEQWA